jgi:signal transduction histidine kinase/predicted negative regulator of RcsB-dependent stress response
MFRQQQENTDFNYHNVIYKTETVLLKSSKPASMACHGYLPRYLFSQAIPALILMAGFLGNKASAYGPKTTDTAQIMYLVRSGKALRDNKPDSAIALLNKALAFSKQSSYANGIAWSYLLIGEIKVAKGSYEEGIALYNQAINHNYKATRNDHLMGIIHIDMGTVLCLKGNYEEAAKFYLQALPYIEKIEVVTERERLTAAVYVNLFSPLFKTRQYQKGIYYLEKGEALARKNNLHSLLVNILINLGTGYKALKKPEQAMEAYLEGLQLAQHYKFRQFELTTYCNIGELLMSQGKYTSAIIYFKKAVEIDDGSDPYYTSSAMESLGGAYYALKDYRHAEPAFLEAIRLADMYGMKNNRLSLHNNLARLYEAMGNYRQAYNHLKEGTDIGDSINDIEGAKNIQELETKYRTVLKDKEIAQKQVLIQRKNISITVILSVMLLLVLSSYAYYRHRNRIQAKKIRILKHENEIQALKAMMDGEERERLRLAQELHDGIGGMLTALNMNVGTIQKKYAASMQQTQDLDGSLGMIQDIAAEVRRTARNLMPDVVVNHGLTEAIRLFCLQLESSSPIQFDFQCYGGAPELDISAALSLYRIVQEILQNIVKHAFATLAVVQLRQYDDKLMIHVEDNGKGFESKEDGKGLGLRNLRARIDALQGYLSIDSSEERGTTIYIEIDFKMIRPAKTPGI